MSKEAKRRLEIAGAWREARRIVASHRSRLALGAFLMAINLLLGFVLPAASKYVIDELIIKGRKETLALITLAAAAAIILQVLTAYWMSQVLSVAGQRVITDMRKKVQAHVGRLPISYFDTTQTGMLITRIMSDAEGLRVLVGNGLVQLGGNVATALASIAILFWLDWRLTTLMIIQPKSGRVKIDGRDLSTINLHDYRSLLGVVLQDNFLFDDTIAENIRFSKPGASLKEIRAVSLSSIRSSATPRNRQKTSPRG